MGTDGETQYKICYDGPFGGSTVFYPNEIRLTVGEKEGDTVLIVFSLNDGGITGFIRGHKIYGEIPLTGNAGAGPSVHAPRYIEGTLEKIL